MLCRRIFVDAGETDEAIVSRASDVKRAVFCTGKVYYDLLQHRMDNNINDVALIRVEQLTPFPFDKVGKAFCFRFRRRGVPEAQARCPAGAGTGAALHQRRGDVGAGGAAQHGRLVLCLSANPGRS